MNTNHRIHWSLLALCVIIVVTVGIWLVQSSSDKASVDDASANHGNTEKANTETAAPAVGTSSEPKPEEVRAGLEAIFAGLVKSGAKRISSAEQAIDQALKTKDPRTIAQAANALVYDSPWPRDEVIVALRKLLENSDPQIKLDGARYLYLIGDDSGRGIVVELMSSKSPILIISPVYSSGSYDLRFSAAEIASKYRDQETKAAVLALYQSTHSLSLLDDLIKVGVANAGQIIKDAMGNQLSYDLMELYGMAKFARESHYMATVKNNESIDMRTRLAAAWASTQVGSNEAAAKFIRDFVEGQIAALTVDLPVARKAVQYLGTQTDTASIAVLERMAKQSSNPDLMTTATVNLVLNHSIQSSVGADLVITELTGKPTQLGIDLAIKLAAASPDPRLARAGQSFDARREGERIWKQQGFGRVHWSLWGWADDFVLSLGAK